MSGSFRAFTVIQLFIAARLRNSIFSCVVFRILAQLSDPIRLDFRKPKMCDIVYNQHARHYRRRLAWKKQVFVVKVVQTEVNEQKEFPKVSSSYPYRTRNVTMYSKIYLIQREK